ncbi:MAG TPA: hypothetical protein DDX16_11540, partial [Candidatus Omnitrophica bacterium]|nr:hypothetical protein [Candidatus Omnitrophota bacterium]
MKTHWRRIILGVLTLGMAGAFFASSSYAVQIKRVQSGAANYDTDDVVYSAALQYPVNQSKSVILLYPTGDTTNTRDQNWFFTGQFEDDSTIAIDRGGGTSPASVLWQVIEFEDGVRVQRGITSMTSTTKTKNITLPVTLDGSGEKAVPIVTTRAAFTTITQTHEMFLLPSFTNNTTMFLERLDATGTKATQIVWQVIEFLDDATVQTGTVSLPVPGGTTNNQTVNATVSEAANPLLFTYFTGNVDINGQDARLYTQAEMLNSTTVSFNRLYATNTANTDVAVRYYLVNLTDPVSYVQSGWNQWLTTAATKTVGASTDASPIQVTITGHGFVSGDLINIGGHGTNLAANGNWFITVIDANTITLNNSSGSGAGAGSGGVAIKAQYSSINSIAPERTMVIKTTKADSGTTNAAYGDDLSVGAGIFNATNVFTIRSARTTAINSNSTYSAIEFCPLTLKLPNGGNASSGYSDREVWRVGQSKNITWKYSNDVAANNISILLNLNNDTNISNYSLIINNSINTSYNNGTYTWTIPEAISGTNLLSANARIAIQDDVLSVRDYDYSNNRFEIKGDINVTAPSGGENWNVGDTRQINWTRYGNMSAINFNITLSTDGGGNWSVLNNSVTQVEVDPDGDGLCIYNWTIGDNDPTGTSMKANITWMGDPGNVTNTSTSTFNVRAKINITEPTNITEWLAQDNGTINWTKNGTWSGNNVSIYYRIGAGSENLISTENASNGTYSWVNISTGAISSNNTYIVIRSGADPDNVYNTSPAFTVHPYIEVTYPNTADVVWNVSDSPNITWNVTGSLSTVDVWYNNTTGWTKVGNDVNATGGNWTWTNIPAAYVSETVTIRVSKHTTGATPIVPYDDANYVIPIRGKLTVTKPASGDILRVGSDESINWTASGFGGADLVRIKFAKFGNFADAGNTTTIAENETATNQTFLWTGLPNNITTSGKVRLEWQTNTTVFNDSDPFSIKGKLNLTSPNSGVYYINGTMAINWTPTGTVGATRLNYTADGGLDGYNHSILNSTDGYDFNESGPYTWTIPDATDISKQIRVKVYAKNDAENVTSNSTANVTIRGILNLTSPDGGEVWQVNTTKNINWTRQGSKMGNITLLYSTDNGTNYNGTINASISSTGVPADTYRYTWTVDNVMSGNPTQKFDQMKIKVAVVGDEDNTSDSSASNFTIVPKIQVTRPDAINNTFYVDENQSVLWGASGDLDKVNLYRSSDGGGNWTLITTEGSEVNDGNYTWNVPNTISNTSKVKVCSWYYNETPSEACGESVNFSVKQKIDIDNPLAGITAVAGQVYQIRWTPHGTLGTVNVSYANYSSGWNFTEITNNTSATSFNWTVPDDMGTNTSKIKIISEVYPEINNTSSAFSIRGYINLTQPATGANISAKSTDTPIRWTYNGSLIGDVSVEYSLDGGLNWTLIENTSVTSGSSYIWPQVPVTTSDNNAKVRVYDVNNSATVSTSGLFNIVSSLNLTSFNGGENAPVGSGLGGVNPQYITWKQSAATLVNVSYSLDNGGNWTLIEQVAPATESMTTNWTIANNTQASNSAKIKIHDFNNPAVYDISTATFNVIAVFNVTDPEDGNITYAQEYYNVTWTKKGNGVNNVILEYRTNDTSSWINIANASDPNATVPNLGYYEWLSVPGSVLSTEAKIRITDPNNANATDMGA